LLSGGVLISVSLHCGISPIYAEPVTIIVMLVWNEIVNYRILHCICCCWNQIWYQVLLWNMVSGSAIAQIIPFYPFPVVLAEPLWRRELGCIFRWARTCSILYIHAWLLHTP